MTKDQYLSDERAMSESQKLDHEKVDKAAEALTAAITGFLNVVDEVVYNPQAKVNIFSSLRDVDFDPERPWHDRSSVIKDAVEYMHNGIRVDAALGKYDNKSE